MALHDSLLRHFVALACFGLAMLSAQPRAHAYAWMIRHGYTNCATCHADPSGGAVLTPYGRAQGSLLLAQDWARFDDERYVEQGELFHGATRPLPEWLMVAIRIVGDHSRSGFPSAMTAGMVPVCMTYRVVPSSSASAASRWWSCPIHWPPRSSREPRTDDSASERPPGRSAASSMTTSMPRRCRSRAATRPESPAPTTSTSTGMSRLPEKSVA